MTHMSMDGRTVSPVRGPDFRSEILFGPVRGPDFGPDFLNDWIIELIKNLFSEFLLSLKSGPKSVPVRIIRPGADFSIKFRTTYRTKKNPDQIPDHVPAVNARGPLDVFLNLRK